MKKKLICRTVLTLCVTTVHAADSNVVLFEDGFGQMRSGSIGSEVGAPAEYH